MLSAPSQIWRHEQAGAPLSGRGQARWLEGPLTAFFASRRCPGSAIRAGLDWVLKRAREQAPVISGFHSPLERSALELLLEARSPAIAVLARSVSGARLVPRWEEAIAQGHLVVVSAAMDSRQISSDRALARNELVAQLASVIVVAHADPGGGLNEQIQGWRKCGFVVHTLYD